MIINEIKEEREIILQVEGRIDTNTSVILQGEILRALQKTNILTLDLEKTNYVSSAGLRTFLIAYKTAEAKGGSFQLQNISEIIFDILSKSGFLKFLKIKEAKK